jgi:hypothetical protein
MRPNSDSTAFNVKTLEHLNYSTWKIEMQALLRSKGYWKTVSGDASKVIESTQGEDIELSEDILKARMDVCSRFEEKDERALGLISLSVNETYRELLRDCKTSQGAWELLQEYFESKEAFNKVFLLKSLVNLRLEARGDIEEYVKNKRKLQRRLGTCGLQLDDDIMVVLLLIGLPPEMDTFIRILETDSKISLEKVERELQKEIIKQKSSSGLRKDYQTPQGMSLNVQ